MTATDFLADHEVIDTHQYNVGEDPTTRDSQAACDTHSPSAVPGPSTPPTRRLSTPRVRSSAEPNSPRDLAGAQDSGDHRRDDPHTAAVAAPAPQDLAIECSVPTQRTPGLADQTRPAPIIAAAIPRGHQLGLADPLLALAADVLDDLERVRIANENRLRQLTRDETDKDGQERGFGLTIDHPDVARLAALVDALSKAEHDAELNLKRMVRRHPLGPWIKQAKGVGEKQSARLLAAIGDPFWNDLHNRPRTVSELWSFCGYSVHKLPVSHTRCDSHSHVADGAPAPAVQQPSDTHDVYDSGNLHPTSHMVLDAQTKDVGGAQADSSLDQATCDSHIPYVGVAVVRQRGVKVNWSPTAKMRAYLISESIVKAGGHYRKVYDQGRAKYTAAIHRVECKRCGPAGKPAPLGSPLSLGHQHARALRLVAKTVLRDLWREAKRIHEDHPSGHYPADTHTCRAAGVHHHEATE